MTTVHLDERPLLRFAVPSSKIPKAVTGTLVPVHSAPTPTQKADREVTAGTSTHQPSLDVDGAVTETSKTDVEVSASGSGSLGPGSITISAISDEARRLRLSETIDSKSSTVNALVLLGLLTVVRKGVESDTTGLYVYCNNDIAITWLGKLSMGKSKSTGHDPEIVERIDELLVWLEMLIADEAFRLDVVRGNPGERIRPSVILHKNDRTLISVGSEALQTVKASKGRSGEG